MVKEMIACRTLKTIHRKTGAPGELSVEISSPYLIQKEMVDFPIHPGAAACSVKFIGLNTDQYDMEVYGVDTLQALHLASAVDGTLKHISKTYDLFFTTGEPYFEPENT